MHELSLYGSVPADRHDRLVQQLAGVTCMQPQIAKEIHVVFKARTPAGLEKVQGSGGGQSINQQQQEVQKLRTMLQSGVYYVQLIGIIHEPRDRYGHQVNGHETIAKTTEHVEWIFEFKDTPEAGQQAVNTRLVSRINFEDGNMQGLLDMLGYEYAHQYLVEGERFYHQDTALFLHRVRKLPTPQTGQSVTDVSKIPPASELPLLDPSASYLLEATIEISDGKIQELRDRATRQLLSVRDTLRSAVTLERPDRLALDTRIPIPVRRI